jgi:uncharacterized membrane protein YgaE (UPF0421/DUF939 family)
MQSTLGATLMVSTQRLIGTAIGAAAGALTATFFHANLIAFGAAVLGIGLLCTLLRLEKGAYRYAGVTLAVVMLIPRADNDWLIAVHRFIEVSLGIAYRYSGRLAQGQQLLAERAVEPH